MSAEPRTIRERFPPPWHVETMPAGYRVLDAQGVPLVYVYAADGDGRRLVSSRGLSKAEARAIAEAITALPAPDKHSR